MNLKKRCRIKELIFQKKLTLIKQVYQENVWFVIISILMILDLNLSQIFVINVVLDVYVMNVVLKNKRNWNIKRKRCRLPMYFIWF